MSKQPEVDLTGPESPHFRWPPGEPTEAAWIEVEPGRYMPQRVRGSCTGRALG